MPEHIAVKCCNAGQCGLFQVSQRRKDNKWQCRLCNQKQSVQKVYAVSFKASDLRPVVQEYNMKKADIDRKEEVVKIQQRKIAEELLEQEANAIISGNYSSQNVDEQQLDEQPKQSRWSKYLEPEQANDNEDDEDDPRYTTLAPQGKRKGGNASSRPSKKPNNLEDKPPAPKTNSAAFGKPTKDSPSTNNKPVHAQTSTAPTFTRKYNQMFQSNTNDSDDEDSTPLFQTSAPPAKPNTVPQSDYGNRSFNNNNSTSNQPKATPKPQAPSTASSGSRWSKYVEESNDQDKDDEDEDDQYVTASAALDSRYQVVQDPEDDER